jgi:hypothetical protein
MLPGQLGSAIYKGKYLDRTVITDIGPMKVRIWESGSAEGGHGFVWWKQEDCMVMTA